MVCHSHQNMATPHPLRKSYLPQTTSSQDSNNTSRAETSTGSPFPPMASNRYDTPSPYAPTSALTSTPQTMQSKPLYRSSSSDTGSTARIPDGRRRSTTAISDAATSVATSKDRYFTPGYMSTSFSAEGIEVDESVIVDDEGSGVAQTPLTAVHLVS